MKPELSSESELKENRPTNQNGLEEPLTSNFSPVLPKVHPASEVAVGDTVRLRKPHPCGSFDWRVVRIGADIGLRCLGCDHRINLTRPVFEKRFKSFLERV